MKKNLVFLALAFAMIIGLGQANYGTVVAGPDEPLAPSSSGPNWDLIGRISQTTVLSDAVLPSIDASISGNKVIVAYIGIINNDSGDRDVFYTVSNNFGASWATKNRIHSSPGNASDSNWRSSRAWCSARWSTLITATPWPITTG